MEIIESSNAERCGIYTFHVVDRIPPTRTRSQQAYNAAILLIDTRR